MQKTLSLSFLLFLMNHTFAQQAKPVFKEGQAQLVPAFSDASEWIKEVLWVQNYFDSDQNGKLDRMHVFLTRPVQTNTESNPKKRYYGNTYIGPLNFTVNSITQISK